MVFTLACLFDFFICKKSFLVEINFFFFRNLSFFVQHSIIPKAAAL